MKQAFLAALLLLAAASAASAEQTALHATVPGSHIVSLSVGGHGEAAVGETLIGGDTALPVERFGSLQIRVLPEWGYRLDTVHASSSHNLTIDGDVISLSGAVQDLSLSLSFVETDAPVMALSAAELTLEPGMTLKMDARIAPAQTDAPVVWRSSDENILSVSGGRVSALAEGRATVTAVCGDLSASCAVEVRRMKTLSFPSALREIADGASRGNRSAECIRLPDGVRTVGAHAFEGCSSLRLAFLPSSVESIGEGAFDGCDRLVLLCEEGADAVIRYAKSHGIPCLLF